MDRTFSVIRSKRATFVDVDVCKASQAGLLDEGHHGCKVSGVLPASLSEVFWLGEPGTLACKHEGDGTEGINSQSDSVCLPHQALSQLVVS